MIAGRVDQRSGWSYRLLGVVRSSLLLVVSLIAAPSSGRAESSACEPCHADVAKKAEHSKLTALHPGESCTGCHGGDSTAKEASAAHASSGAKLMLPAALTSASCARCHLPGAVPGTELLVAGARAYQELGCPFCHKIEDYGSTEKWAMPLGQIGHRGPGYLKQMLNTPFEVFPGTRMPSFTVKWKAKPERETALIGYLLSLRAEPRGKGRVLASAPCGRCHAKEETKKDEIASHRCPELAAPDKDLSCARCHPKGAPESDRECLYVRQRRFDCGVCHMGEKHEPGSP